jgi:predicted  nucleic acid-binding Zn-ribbon protein
MEHYKQLVEIQGLYNNIGKHEENISQQNNRISFVSDQRAKRKNELNELKESNTEILKAITELEKDLFQKEKELEKANGHILQVSSESQQQAIQKEIDYLSPLVDSLQESILEEMDKSSELDEKISQAKQFLEGSAESLADLQEEVSFEIKKEEKEIENYQERIQLLLEALELNIRNTFSATLKSSKNNVAISFLRGRECSICRTEAPSTQVSDIENGRSIEICSGCSRILIPATINAF